MAVKDLVSEAPVGRRHLRLVEVVAAELRRLILAGRWAPGDRLIETQVADELGVSRNPVREALRSLEAEGFVEVAPRRGARVAMMSRDEAVQLFEVRAALEELAAGLAAQRRSPETVAELETIIEAGVAAVTDGRLDDLPALNTRFHLALCDAAANPQLTAIMAPLRDRIQWVYAMRVADRAPQSWDEHAALVTAIASGDEVEARCLAGEHIVRARDAFLGGQKPRTAPPSTRSTAPVM
jgi:DNA-binding GntR family transcriptional regulator